MLTMVGKSGLPDNFTCHPEVKQPSNCVHMTFDTVEKLLSPLLSIYRYLVPQFELPIIFIAFQFINLGRGLILSPNSNQLAKLYYPEYFSTGFIQFFLLGKFMACNLLADNGRRK